VVCCSWRWRRCSWRWRRSWGRSVLFLFSVPLAVFCSLCSLDSLTVSLRPFSSLSTGFSPLFFRLCSFTFSLPCLSVRRGGWCNRRRGWCSCVSWPMLLSVSRFFSSFSCSLCSLFFSFFFSLISSVSLRRNRGTKVCLFTPLSPLCYALFSPPFRDSFFISLPPGFFCVPLP